jgi:hypothetical protein
VTIQVVLGAKHDLLLWGRYGLQMIKTGRALRIREIDYVYQSIFAIGILRQGSEDLQDFAEFRG